MAKYLRPRRGSQANAIAQKILLKKGEMFLEFPESEIGKGPGRLVIGDGATQYQNMDYATTATNVFRPFITDPEIFIPRFTDTEPSSSEWSVDAGTAAIAKMGNGSSTSTVTLPTIIGAIKETLCKHADSITKLNNDLDNVNLMIDNEYSPDYQYYKGQYCVYNGVLYRAKTDIPVGTPFSTDNWEYRQIGLDLYQMNNSIIKYYLATAEVNCTDVASNSWGYWGYTTIDLSQVLANATFSTLVPQLCVLKGDPAVIGLMSFTYNANNYQLIPRVNFKNSGTFIVQFVVMYR